MRQKLPWYGVALLLYAAGSIALIFWADTATALAFQVALLIGTAAVFLVKSLTSREPARQHGAVAAGLTGAGSFRLASLAGPAEWAPYLDLVGLVFIATAALMMPATFWKQPVRLWRRPAAELSAARDVRSDT